MGKSQFLWKANACYLLYVRQIIKWSSFTSKPVVKENDNGHFAYIVCHYVGLWGKWVCVNRHSVLYAKLKDLFSLLATAINVFVDIPQVC